MARIIGCGFVYFVFVLGAYLTQEAMRHWWTPPPLLVRTDVLAVVAVLAVMVLTARWVTRTVDRPMTLAGGLGIGGVALGLMILFDLVVREPRLTLSAAMHDPAATVMYVAMLAVLMAMPALVLANGEVVE